MVKRIIIVLILLNSFILKAQIHKHSLGFKTQHNALIYDPFDLDRILLVNYQLGVSDKFRLDFHTGFKYQKFSEEWYFRGYDIAGAFQKVTTINRFFNKYIGGGLTYRNLRTIFGGASHNLQLNLPIGVELDLKEVNTPLLLNLQISPNLDLWMAKSNLGTYVSYNISASLRYVIGND